MAEITLHLAPTPPYTLGPAHALLALEQHRRAQAVHLLEGLRCSWAPHEAFSMPRLLRYCNPADYDVVWAAVTDLLQAGALLLAVTPLPGGSEPEEGGA